MVEPNPVIQRLKEQNERSTGMIAPWLRDMSARQPSSGTASNPETHSRSSFRLAVQNRRLFGDKKKDLIQPEKINHFSKFLSQKYQNARELVPLSTKFTREMGLWGDLDRIFPNAASISKPEEPLQPGELRSGSIIQKFVPPIKTGESSPGFKGQAANTSVHQRQRDAASTKNKPLPGQRLFTRVTEITPKVQPEEELPLHEQPVESPAEPVKLSPAADLPKMQEPLVEPTQPAIETQTRQADSSTPALPVQASSLDQIKPEPAAAMPLAQPPARKESAKIEGNAKPKAKTAAKPLSNIPETPAAPAKLLKAMPVKKEQPKPVELPKALPLAAKPVKPVKPVIPSKQSPVVSKVVQRQSDLPESPKKEEPQAFQHFVQAEDKPAQSQKEEESPLSQTPSEQKLEPRNDTVEMPLHEVMEHRKQFAREVKHTPQVGQKTPSVQPVSLNRPILPLLSPKKYSFEADANLFSERKEVAAIPGEQQRPLTFDLAAPQSIGISNNIKTFTYDQPAIPEQKQMLPSTMQEIKPASQSIQTQSQQLQKTQLVNTIESVNSTSPVEPNISLLQKKYRSTKSSQASSSVVQRATDEQGSSDSAKTVEPSSPPVTDYRKLAEDVFPYVKRLLETETERTHGSLR